MEKPRSGSKHGPKTSQRKPFGAKSLQVSEDEASRLVGGIVEKGISDAPLPPSSAPRLTVLPFPVARHRSHGPPELAPRSCVLPQKLSPDNNAKAQDVTMEEMDPESLEEVSQSTIVEKRVETMEDSVLLEGIESQIDAENRAQLQRMSANEIAEAQAEIMERMTPAVIETLRKRGQNKLKKQKESSSVMAAKGEVGNLQDGKQLITDAKDSPLYNSDISENVMTATSTDTRSGLGCDGMQNLKPGSSSLWDSWSDTSTRCGYTADNVSQRDFLRTEGDPGAAGYTIKEAVALTRSVVPGQRALALHLLASVLDKALHNICQKQVGYNVKVGNDNRFIDWGAVWAYALGPEPELALSLR
ncbi:RPAP1-like, carboxy-terminal protein [Actinidia rufa]|uniref:RPAP1-like, carboxy-terminal protein n=1 Tax=Actinidia rufa TaxID=165716 RepID=A0A7J0ETH0_9ERIC|nr:RPAP1-like, carboxy-terminal protein [Actinidia rufa]